MKNAKNHLLVTVLSITMFLIGTNLNQAEGSITNSITGASNSSGKTNSSIEADNTNETNNGSGVSSLSFSSSNNPILSFSNFTVTETNVVQKTSAKISGQSVYYYALIPGADADETSGSADDRWFGLGVITTNDLEDVNSNPDTSISYNIASTTKTLYPDITYNGVTYHHATTKDEELKQGYYTLKVYRLTVASGANAGYNQYNPTASGSQYHLDHVIVLNEANYNTITFNVKYPSSTSFETLTDYAARLKEGTAESTIKKPTASDVPETKKYNGVTYVFDGWYTDETCTKKADFNGTIKANTNYYGKYIPKTSSYKVEHYTENLDGTYSLKDTEENLTGNTNSNVTATAKSYSGFTYDSSIENTVSSGKITEDNSLVLKLYYKRESYTVTYDYTGEVPSDATTLPSTKTYKYEQSVSVAAAATAKGYTFSGWSKTGTFTMPNNNLTITGSFSIREDLSYTVNYLLKDDDTDDSNNTVLSTAKTVNNQKYNSTITTQNEVIDITGYKYDSADKETLTIGTDTTANVINIYYVVDESQTKDLSYTVEYYKDGELVSEDTQTESTTVQILQSDTMKVNSEKINTTDKYDGYKLEKTDPETIPETVNNGDVIKVYYVKRTDLSYTVNYLEKDTNKELSESKTVDGNKYLSKVTEEAIAIEGYTLDGDKNATITINTKENVINFYYTINKYNLKINYVYAKDNTEASTSYTETLNYNSDYEVSSPEIKGYTADQAVVTGTIKGNTVITVKYTANEDTAYKVEHYLENIENNEYTLDTTENKTGTTDTLTQAESKKYNGFTAQSFEQENINGDGSTVVKIYYNRNKNTVVIEPEGGKDPETKEEKDPETHEDVKYGDTITLPELTKDYTLTYEEADEVSNKLGKDTRNATLLGYCLNAKTCAEPIKAGTKVTVTEGATYYASWSSINFDVKKGSDYQTTSTDYKFVNWTREKTNSTVTDGTTISLVSDEVLKANYESSAREYSIKINYIYEDGSIASDTYTDTLKYNDNYEVVSPEIVGYKADITKVSGIITGNVEETVTYIANENTAYKVEHYLENVDDDDYTLTDKQTLSGKTNEITKAEAKEYTGFTAQEFTQEKIAADGTTIIKIYYKRNTYKVTYEYTGEVPENATKLPSEESYKYEASVEVAENASAKGYTFSGWDKEDFTMPQENVTIKGSFKINNIDINIDPKCEDTDNCEIINPVCEDEDCHEIVCDDDNNCGEITYGETIVLPEIKKHYTLTYVENANVPEDKKQVAKIVNVELLGYCKSFDGTTCEDGELIAAGTKYQITDDVKNITFIAVWGESESIAIEAGSDYKTSTIEGKFTKWVDKDNQEVKGNITLTEDTTIYANYEVKPQVADAELPPHTGVSENEVYEQILITLSMLLLLGISIKLTKVEE